VDLRVFALGGIAKAWFYGRAPAATPSAGNLSTDAHGMQWKTIEDYCYKCHTTEDWAGSLAFDTMSTGYVPLRRLNRREYANSVCDLLGLEIEAATWLPQDPLKDDFDSNAELLQMNASFMD
jgi:hypothetical protein